MVLRSFFGRRDDDDRPAPRAGEAPLGDAQGAPPAAPFAQRMATELSAVRWLGRGAGRTLPIKALPMLADIEDELAPLLSHLEHHPPNAEEEFAVQAMLTDYLPSTLRAYIGLAPRMASVAGPDGRTAADQLLEQLGLLGQAARDLAAAIYSHDAQELATQGRFLSAKFQQSDLAL